MAHDNRKRSAARLLATVLAIALANVLVHRVGLPHVDLPRPSDLPLPGWAAFLLGPGKLIALVVIAVLVAGVREAARRRHEPDA